MTQMDRRYSSRRWRKVRLVVLRRDNYSCWVQACPELANVADHIEPSFQGMPDAEFYGLHNLRASCKRHNTARGVAARLERETAEGVAPLPRRSVYSTAGRFFRGPRELDRPLAKSLSLTPYVTVTGDYTRQEPERGAG